MPRRLLLITVLAIAFLAQRPARSAAPPTPAAPPVAAVRPVQDTYFGTAVTDPYRWMETLTDPEVQSWFRGQADYTSAVLAQIPGRAALLARIQALDKTTTYVMDVQQEGPYVFYEKRRPQDDNYKLYVRTGFHGPERLLVDPETLTQNGVHSSLSNIAPSLDGKYVVYGLSPGGSEDCTLHVMETATGKTLPDTINRTWFAGVAWLPDGHSFLYNRLQKLAPGQPLTDKESDSKVYRHTLGADPDTQDTLLLGKGVNSAVPFEDIDVPEIIYTPGAPRSVFAIDDRGVQNEIALWSAPLAALGGDPAQIPWVPVCGFGDDVTTFDAHAGRLYLLSHKNAPHFKILVEDAAAPDIAHAAGFAIPHGTTVITGLGAASDALYLHGRGGAKGFLARAPYDAKPAQMIPLPFVGALDPQLVTDPRRGGALFLTESGTHSPAAYRYNPATAKFGNTGLQPKIPADFSHVAQIETYATAPDGTPIPLSILYPKGMKLDGSHPALLDGYGAYSISNDLYFNPRLLAWIERGGVYAVAHVRGGGEEGETWYRAGYKATKPNTWRDFIACGQYSVARKFTSPAKLSGEGTSAGGILISRAVTERPDLWGAALIRVGCSNALRMEFSPNGPDNIPEFGSVTTPDGFQALSAMDGFQHVKDGVKYPAVLLTTGINDPRVASWQPAKMTARLQAAETTLPAPQRRPVLLRVDYDAGHGIGSTKSQAERDQADEWSFLLWQLGQPGFQPKR